MKELNGIYNNEMNEKYNVHLDTIEEVEDWTKEEKVWYDWLQEKLKKEERADVDTENIVRDELVEFVYNCLLYRNMKEPETIDGIYRANKVVRINKLLVMKGGLKPWKLPEIKCAGLYTIHPVWYIDPSVLEVDVASIRSADYEKYGIPDVLALTKTQVKFPGKSTVYDVYLENTNFAEAQIKYNANWSPITSLKEGGGVYKE